MRRHWKASLLFLGLMVLLAATASAMSGTGWRIDWFTVDAGGGLAAGGDFTLQGTAGQADAGQLTGGSYIVDGGFWPAPAGSHYLIYLPMIDRGLPDP